MNRTEHLLVVLMEEAAEVQQAAAKALRFGLDDYYDHTSNVESLSNELNDLYAAVTMLKNGGVLLYADAAAKAAKIEKVEHYLKYSERYGTLQGDYDQLIMAVSRIAPGESRHQTVLRYIRQAEAATQGLAQNA